MSSTWGNRLRLSIFGESHGGGIGVVLDGLPSGIPIDWDEVLFQMARRAPRRDSVSTARREADVPEVLSGLYNGHTEGTPLCAVIRNTDLRSSDYEKISHVPRPGHADFTAEARYHGFQDPRGGGHFSGRLTAPMVFAGAVCRQALSKRGVTIGAHILSIGRARDRSFDPVAVNAPLLDRLTVRRFPVLEQEVEQRMREVVAAAASQQDSVGGVVECAAVGLPAGLGSPIFDGVENRLASILFGIPAVKGLEFGAGFGAAELRGSENNDPFMVEDGAVRTASNRHGGILGGITSGMPLIFRLAFKPTPSIARPQQSVDLKAKTPATLSVRGRHDPCVVLRAVPVAEALAAVCLLDLFLEEDGYGI